MKSRRAGFFFARQVGFEADLLGTKYQVLRSAGSMGKRFPFLQEMLNGRSGIASLTPQVPPKARLFPSRENRFQMLLCVV